MRSRLLGAWLCALTCAAATAQTNGSFYLERNVFAPNEPVFLYFKLTNRGSLPIDVPNPGTELPGCSGISITVRREDDKNAQFLDDAEATGLCVINGAGWSSISLLPGQSKTDRFLLNYRHDIAVAGNYRVEAKKAQKFGDDLMQLEQTLRFRVDPHAPPLSVSQLQKWVNQLSSPEIEKRLEAARTLASIAPPAVEKTLFSFARNPEFESYFAFALYRLHTQRSMEALAGLIRKGKPGSSEYGEAANYLAETEDQKWYPLLVEAAKKGAPMGYTAYAAAAELGGEKSIPLLMELAKSPNSFASINAVTDFGETGSRAAIPILLQFLQSKDASISDSAARSLEMLTHRTASPNRGSQVRDLRHAYMKWSNWWQRDGATAPVFREKGWSAELSQELTALP